MAKFIIEISDEQIRNLSNIDKATERLKGDEKENPMQVLFDIMAGSIIEKKLDEGIEEFHISRDMMERKEAEEFFDKNVGDICMLANFATKDEEEDEK